MTEALASLLTELEQFGEANDRTVSERSGRMLNITPDTGPFLALLIRALKAKRVLEIGTSNGYSTLWLADAIEPHGGTVTTVEISPFKVALARQNFSKVPLQSLITIHNMDAGAFLKSQQDAIFDFLFLDSYRIDYPSWWPDIQRILRHGALVVCDNASTHSADLAPFVEVVQQTPGYRLVTVPVGHGQLVILKEVEYSSLPTFL